MERVDARLAVARRRGDAATPTGSRPPSPTASFCLQHLRREDGRWLRSWQRDGGARHLAFAADYAALVQAFVSLGQATGQRRWIDAAVSTADAMLDLFWDPAEGGLFTTGRDGEALVTRAKDLLDNATPAANSLAAFGLLRLAALTGDQRYREHAERVLALLGPLAGSHPLAFRRASVGGRPASVRGRPRSPSSATGPISSRSPSPATCPTRCSRGASRTRHHFGRDGATASRTCVATTRASRPSTPSKRSRRSWPPPERERSGRGTRLRRSAGAGLTGSLASLPQIDDATHRDGGTLDGLGRRTAAGLRARQRRARPPLPSPVPPWASAGRAWCEARPRSRRRTRRVSDGPRAPRPNADRGETRETTGRGRGARRRRARRVRFARQRARTRHTGGIHRDRPERALEQRRKPFARGELEPRRRGRASRRRAPSRAVTRPSGRSRRACPCSG